MGRKPRGGGMRAVNGKEDRALVAGYKEGNGGSGGGGSSLAFVGENWGNLGEDSGLPGNAMARCFGHCSICVDSGLGGVLGLDLGAAAASGGAAGGSLLTAGSAHAGDWLAAIKGSLAGCAGPLLRSAKAGRAMMLEVEMVVAGVGEPVLGAAPGAGWAGGLPEVREMVARGMTKGKEMVGGIGLGGGVGSVDMHGCGVTLGLAAGLRVVGY